MAKRKRILYTKAAGGVMVGQPGAERETGFENYMSTITSSTDVLKNNSKSTAVPKVSTGSPFAPVTNSQPSQGMQQGVVDSSGVGPDTSALGVDSRLSSTLSGVASGAAAGASFGVIGMGVGAAIGGITGLMKGSKQKKANDEARVEAVKLRKEQEEQLQMAKAGALRKYNTGRNRHLMSQADSLYGGDGKTVGIARRGGIVYSPRVVAIYDVKQPVKSLNIPITSSIVRKASKGAKITLQEKVMLCSRADGSCSLVNRSEVDIPIFRRGGALQNKFKKNIIPHGVSHEQENNTGIKGDKGIPVVKGGEKQFELEKSEWVLNADASEWIRGNVYKFLKEPSDDILMELGAKVREELLQGTYSYDNQYAHLNA